MRLLSIIPELLHHDFRGSVTHFIMWQTRLWKLPVLRDMFVHPGLYTPVTWGGTLNIMRHTALARSLGVEAALCTPRGVDTYGRFGITDLPYVSWDSIQPDDVCILPDFCTDLADRIRGRVIVYLQVPAQLNANFDYLNPRIRLWTDSPFMLELCQRVFPGKDIPIVPNIVDPLTFPFRPQSEREPGLIFAFPRKGPKFIEETRAEYERMGGKYWHFQLVDGLSLNELAREMQRPQAFLASADMEGCALPPQESMATGMVVVGKTARGANFAMEHRRTAMVADTPAEAAACLRELEDEKLRNDISRAGHAFISRYFPDREPTQLWRRTLRELGMLKAETPAPAPAPVATGVVA